jgi:large subunit ribosomal protein L23
MDYTKVLIKPVISEKATQIKEEAGQVAFFVHPRANKIQIREAVEQAFKVKVDGVKVVRRKPTLRKRFGRTTGRVPGHKKAYVSLAPGEKIEFFEGV